MAFFKMSRSCLRRAFSRSSCRSRSSGAGKCPRPGNASAAWAVNWRRQWKSVPWLNPKSRSICEIDLPLVFANWTASHLNSRVYFFRCSGIRRPPQERVLCFNAKSTFSGAYHTGVIPCDDWDNRHIQVRSATD